MWLEIEMHSTAQRSAELTFVAGFAVFDSHAMSLVSRSETIGFFEASDMFSKTSKQFRGNDVKSPYFLASLLEITYSINGFDDPLFEHHFLHVSIKKALK